MLCDISFLSVCTPIVKKKRKWKNQHKSKSIANCWSTLNNVVWRQLWQHTRDYLGQVGFKAPSPWAAVRCQAHCS
jgi:hypothetical protein